MTAFSLKKKNVFCKVSKKLGRKCLCVAAGVQTNLLNSYRRDFVNQRQKMCRTTRLVKQIINLLSDSVISYFYLCLLLMLLLNPHSFLFTLSLLFLLWAQFLLKSSKALSFFFF